MMIEEAIGASQQGQSLLLTNLLLHLFFLLLLLKYPSNPLHDI